MRVLFTGKGKGGSWKIRGEQLASALQAKATQQPTSDDVRQADIVIQVKRVPEQHLELVRQSGKPWVYDIVDAYPQPEAMQWQRSEAVSWVRRRIDALRPSAVIWPTQRMREDCDTGLPGLVLKHHHRPGIQINQIREKVQAVAYEGRAEYLAEWAPRLADECQRRGWTFVANPAHLADIDVVVAVRGGQWDGYVARHWKSNVKLANAHGSGTPFIGQRESGYLETATGAEYWADSIAEMRTAFDWLESQSAREQIADRFLDAAYPVERAANDLARFLEDVA